MSLPPPIFRPLAAVLIFANFCVAGPGFPLENRVLEVRRLLEGAEQRFQAPSEQWFYETQTALREEVVRVETALDAMDPNQAAAWRSHLHWHLLKDNLHSMSVSHDDLALVRRWLFSNREGLEDPLFAELRTRMDAHLDAVFTFSHDDLRSTFVEQIELARRQCDAIVADPTDTNAVALGRTLGWLERTGQLAEEVAAVRSLLSQPNAQIVVSTEFAQRLLGLFETEVDRSVPVRETDQAPPSGILRTSRTMQVRGTAQTIGSTELLVVPNLQEAEIRLLFRGEVVAHCTADAGPAEIHVLTAGPVEAVKPILLSTAGLSLGETTVESRVHTHLKHVTARNRLIRRIARRRANQPSARAFMNSSGTSRTVSMLEENLDARVEEAIEEIRAEFTRVRESMDGFREILAPVAREGAVPQVHGMRSHNGGIEINVAGQRRHQFGALVPYRNQTLGGDLQLRVHVSFFNNTLETILGGKTLSDEFLMRYAKILQPQLPLPLMVHSRSRRWAITTNKHRPLELRLPETNRLQLIMRIEAVQIAGQTYEAPATATMDYELVKNDFDEYELMRDGQVHLDTALPTDARAFLHEKLDAFFAPVLNGGGVAVPDGGVIGSTSGVELAGLEAADEWLALGVNVPQQVFDSVMQYQREQELPATVQ